MKEDYDTVLLSDHNKLIDNLEYKISELSLSNNANNNNISNLLKCIEKEKHNNKILSSIKENLNSNIIEHKNNIKIVSELQNRIDNNELEQKLKILDQEYNTVIDIIDNYTKKLEIFKLNTDTRINKIEILLANIKNKIKEKYNSKEYNELREKNKELNSLILTITQLSTNIITKYSNSYEELGKINNLKIVDYSNNSTYDSLIQEYNKFTSNFELVATRLQNLDLKSKVYKQKIIEYNSKHK